MKINFSIAFLWEREFKDLKRNVSYTQQVNLNPSLPLHLVSTFTWTLNKDQSR